MSLPSYPLLHPASPALMAATPLHCVQLLPDSCASPCTVSSSFQAPTPPWYRHLPLALGDDANASYSRAPAK